MVASPGDTLTLRTTRRTFTVSLTLLLLLDALFIGLHLLRAALNDTSHSSFLLDVRWSVEIDRSYPEMFQYLQAALTAITLAALYVLCKSLTYLGWTLAYVFILMDDAFSLHERFTQAFGTATSFPPVFGLETRLYAASILWGGVGLGLLGVVGLGYYRDRKTRAFSRKLCYLLLALFFFGGILDALHLLASTSDLSRWVTFSLGTLEDGGEIVVMSFSVAFSLAQLVLLRSQRRSSGGR